MRLHNLDEGYRIHQAWQKVGHSMFPYAGHSVCLLFHFQTLPETLARTSAITPSCAHTSTRVTKSAVPNRTRDRLALGAARQVTLLTRLRSLRPLVSWPPSARVFSWLQFMEP